MSAIHPFLNSNTEINASYIDRLYDDGRRLIDQAAADINRIAANLPPLNFTGITPNLTDPTAYGIGAMPTAPTKPILNDVPIDAFPVSPVLTTELIASDNLLLDLVSQIKTAIQYRMTHATGLNVDVENALFARAVDRESRLTRQAYQRYIDANAAVGWSSPSGQDQAAAIAFETDKQEKLSDINRDIMIKQAELEQSNTQKNLELYQSFQAQLFDQKRSDEANKIHLFEVKMDAVIKKATLYIDINKGFIDIFANEVQAYVAQSHAVMDEARFRMEQVSALNAMNSQLSSIAMEKLKLISQDNAQRAGIANEASKSIASVLGQLAATLFNSINISESFGSSKSWGYSESVST